MANLTDAAESGLIKVNDLADARKIEFVTSFGGSLKKLMELLGVMRLIAKEEGTTLYRHRVKGGLNANQVGEGEVIPLSHYETENVDIGDITLKKYRKATSAEAIIRKGYEQAVVETTGKMERDVQKDVRTDIISGLSIVGQPTATGEGLQAALANAWGKLQVAFEDDSVESVYFVNPMDVSDYLGKAQVTVQTAFGMKYIEDFLGLGTVILNSGITAKTFYATAKENMVGYFINVGAGNIADVFDLTTDETGFVGITEFTDKTRATCENLVMSGIRIFADNEAGVVKGTITAPLGE